MVLTERVGEMESTERREGKGKGKMKEEKTQGAKSHASLWQRHGQPFLSVLCGSVWYKRE
jgi:hypothetical protein